MADFITVMQKIWNEGFGIFLDVYGFYFSFKHVFMWSLVAWLIFGVVGWLLFDN